MEYKVLLLGAPGSGKGTQAKYLVDEFNFEHIAMGDLLRSEVKNQSKLGIEAKSFMDQGALVPDEVVNNMVANKLGVSNVRPSLLDGFPRTLPQADFLTNKGIKFNLVIYFKISIDAVLDRMSGRLTCLKCGASFHKKYNQPQKDDICDHCNSTLIVRDDDKPETVKKRFETFINQTQPLLDYYKRLSDVLEINAEDDIAIIQEKIKAKVVIK